MNKKEEKIFNDISIELAKAHAEIEVLHAKANESFQNGKRLGKKEITDGLKDLMMIEECRCDDCRNY